MQNNLLTFESVLSKHPELTSSKLLVALSGGIDSMVLCHILLEAGIKFSAAHCNFGLRDRESDEDENFVKKFCKENHIEIFSKRFDVEAFRKTGNYSTQMAARELRYAWFDELIQLHHFDLLLTAHHLSDSVETFIINLSRGTGIKGLSGIREKSGYILRPLLSYSKNEISEYAERKELSWREDSSNFSDDYVRNRIRHHILPELEKLHPNFYQNFINTVENLQSDSEILSEKISELKKELFVEKDRVIRISVKELKNLKPLDSFLHHLFSEYGFLHPLEIKKLINSNNNGEILAKNYRLIKNRDEFLLTARDNEDLNQVYEIKEGECTKKIVNLKVLRSVQRDLEAVECLDSEKISFPLRLRQKKDGDYFAPLGMSGSKKLSKFFKDEKFSKLEKENTWLLTDYDDNILYVVGKRISEKYKVTNKTQNYLNIYLC